MMRDHVTSAPIFSAACAALFMTACAGGPTNAECAGADWSALGLADGRAGLSPKRADDQRRDCAASGFAVDYAAYESGRAQGLKTYCTASGGFEAGKTGADYVGLCPDDTEMEFMESFSLGRKLHTLTEAKEEAVRDYEGAIADLDQHRYLLRVAEKRYAKPSISNEDREHESQDADFRRREIARIEGRLPEMLDRIEETRAALDAYRIELLSMGLEL